MRKIEKIELRKARKARKDAEIGTRLYWDNHEIHACPPPAGNTRKGRRRWLFACSGIGNAIAFPNFKPSVKTISLRLPEAQLEELKMLADKKDVPCHSLLQVYLAGKVEEALKTA